MNTETVISIVSTVISFLSMVISIVGAVISSKQGKAAQEQVKIAREALEQQKREDLQADLDVDIEYDRIYSIVFPTYIRIENIGRATARNIRLLVKNDDGWEPREYVGESEIPPKSKIKISSTLGDVDEIMILWDDDYQKDNKVIVSTAI